jgi:hypothetical protein
MEISQIQFAVGAVKDDLGLIVTVWRVISRQLEAGSMLCGHAVLGRLFGPITACTGCVPAITLRLLRRILAPGSSLRQSQYQKPDYNSLQHLSESIPAFERSHEDQLTLRD